MIEKFYTKTATIERQGWTTDIDGNEITEVSDVATISGHLQQANPEQILNVADIFTLSHIFWCASGSDIKEGDVVKIDSERYGVRGIQDNTFVGANQHLEVQLEKETDNAGV